MNELEKIVILKLNDKRDKFTTIPKELKGEVSRKIGSQFSKGTRDCIRGLSPVQERVYLPDILGLQTTDPQFPSRARDFWADFTITPTVKGIRLNIATTKGKTIINGTEQDIDIPVNWDDYIMYQFCLKSDKVATNELDISNLGLYDFYIEDLVVQQEKENKAFELKDSADEEYVRLTMASKIESNMDKINWILEMTKEKGTYYDEEKTTTLEKKMLLSKLKDAQPATFISIVKDENLEHKAFLNKLLTYMVITKEGNDYFDGDVNMGTDKQAVSYLKDTTKSARVLALKSKLNEKIENTKR